MNNTPSKTGIAQIIQSLVAYKEQVIINCEKMIALEKQNEDLSVELVDRTSSPLVLEWRGCRVGHWKKEINQRVWKRLIFLLNLERYMLCSEYDKLQKEIDENKVPEFTLSTVTLWVENLKSLIYDNMEKLVKEVFRQVTEGTYRTGGGWNAPKKKRNNNGIDKYFILYTGDLGCYGSAHYNPTITDDIEKCIYILAGEPLPDPSLRARMYKEDTYSGETPWFKIKCYGNGNTHYWITDQAILDKLNRVGSSGSSLFGENIKIKIFD